MISAAVPLPQQQVKFTAEAVKNYNRERFNPLRALTPETLAAALDSFKAGHLSGAALLFEAMAERDDTLASVKAKRDLSPTQTDWQILHVAGADPIEAERHATALRWFYNNLSATNAFDRNEVGGIELLLQQMMQAESYRYAVHHLVWKPMPGKVATTKHGKQPVPLLTAEFEFVPLYFFENSTGRLRLITDRLGINGIPLNFESGEWMVSTGRGLMFSASVCYQFKRLGFQDWMAWNERFAQGKVIGRTPAQKNTPEGDAMAEMVAAFTGDMAAVVYGDQGGDKSPIEVLEPAGRSDEMFAKFVERADRKLAAMYRGADLSTMSAGSGSGTGASLQASEAELLEQSDLRRLAGTLQRSVDRHVIRFSFGKGVEPLAYFALPLAIQEDARQVRESAGFLSDRGVPLAAASVAERLGFAVLPAGHAKPTLGAARS